MILQHLEYLASKNILLGSASPRRQQLLSQMGLKFNTKVSGFAEDLDKKDYPKPADYVSQTSLLKAQYIQQALKESDNIDMIICADTIVALDDKPWKILEKPEDREQARSMIQSLSGKSHYVITGVSIVLPKHDNEFISFCETTKVYFAELSEKEIEAYVNTQEPYDKAGGYGIQGVAGCFVERLDGCYYNVMGLPIHHLCKKIAHLVESNKI